ncbi:MAG: extracellular solute-binding protein [Trueperaceae bacterium]|nr:extracellular solute-binding protein [Trueperaceae bacterium]
MEELVAPFEEDSGIDVQFEEGGNTAEVQRQYLNTVLQSQSDDIDIFLIDVTEPSRYAAAGWAEPLNQYFDSEQAMMDYLDAFLPGPVEANLIDGTLYALPSYTDAQFLYDRTDLLEKYGFDPPETWDEMVSRRSPSCRARTTPACKGSTIRARPSRAPTAPSSSRCGPPAATGRTRTATSPSTPTRAVGRSTSCCPP